MKTQSLGFVRLVCEKETAMLRKFKEFASEETGAITVDWVVLTAVVLGILFGALTTFNQGAVDHAELTATTLEELDIPDY